MAQTEKQLSQVLLEQGLVTNEQLSFATQEESRTGTSAWKVLLERGVLTERDLVKARAAQVGMEFIDVRAENPAPDVVALVPAEVAKRQMVMPVRVQDGSLVVAMAEPRNHLAIDERLPKVKVGPGTDPDSEMGPLITREHRDKVAS